MNETEIFRNIGKIIERDNKSTTYKFALLRGVIDIIQENSPFIKFENTRVLFPTGLLLEKWMLYYYPILEATTNIPQINGANYLSFEIQMKKIIGAYKSIGGFSAFYNDLKNKGIPHHIHPDFILLARKLKSTITGMPMKYIGRSITNEYYSIFNFQNGVRKKNMVIDLQYLIKSFGTFSISSDYYEAFKLIGSFVNGQDSILFKWAEFSVKASGQNLSIEKVVNEVLKSPIQRRDIQESKKIYSDVLERDGTVFCVWTNKPMNSYDVDHVIPFTIWKNNDLWNLLPSDPKTNNLKRDRIPSISVIEKRKDLIIHYWELISKYHPIRFEKEIQVALLGDAPFVNWQPVAIEQLKRRCNYLITNRGYMEWNV